MRPSVFTCIFCFFRCYVTVYCKKWSDLLKSLVWVFTKCNWHIFGFGILSRFDFHMATTKNFKKNKNFMASFYGWDLTAARLEPLRGGSLLFTTKFPQIPGTHFTDLGRIKGCINLGATRWF